MKHMQVKDYILCCAVNSAIVTKISEVVKYLLLFYNLFLVTSVYVVFEG